MHLYIQYFSIVRAHFDFDFEFVFLVTWICKSKGKSCTKRVDSRGITNPIATQFPWHGCDLSP